MKIKFKGKIVLEKDDGVSSCIEEPETNGGYFTNEKYDDNLSVIENIRKGNGLKPLEKEN